MFQKASLLPLIFFVFLMAPFTYTSAQASEADLEPAEGAVLCWPGVYEEPPAGCLPLGPSVFQTRMAQLGVTLPFQPLHYEPPDFELTYVPYYYGRVATDLAPVFASVEDAVKGKPAIEYLEKGFTFISYSYTEVVKGVRVYMIGSGRWMTANDVVRIAPSLFQGVVFSRTPRTPFGWILRPVETRSTPGYQPGTKTGRWLSRYMVLPILASQTIDEIDWYMVRPDEWIDQRLIGAVFPAYSAPKGVEGGRWIEVNLFEQTVVAYENNQMVFATLTSSGIDPFWTRPGLFQIEIKLKTTPMRGAFEADRSDYYYLEDVPWTMYYDEARALHGAYWHNGFGYPRSHGCLNLSVGDARWFFDWASVGDWVFVFDPSGNTPSDPSLYSAGGA